MAIALNFMKYTYFLIFFTSLLYMSACAPRMPESIGEHFFLLPSIMEVRQQICNKTASNTYLLTLHSLRCSFKSGLATNSFCSHAIFLPRSTYFPCLKKKLLCKHENYCACLILEWLLQVKAVNSQFFLLFKEIWWCAGEFLQYSAAICLFLYCQYSRLKT